jgi:DNA-binding transcriptional regulator PaaX
MPHSTSAPPADWPAPAARELFEALRARLAGPAARFVASVGY